MTADSHAEAASPRRLWSLIRVLEDGDQPDSFDERVAISIGTWSRPNGFLNVTLTAPNKVAFRGGPGVAFIIAQLQALNVLEIQEIARTAA